MNKMRTMKKLLSLLLAFVLVVSVSSTAFADAPYENYAYNGLSSFHMISYGSNNGYVKTVQRFFTCYSQITRSSILNSGGIDGVFGATTQQLVKNFQSDHNLAVDGVVGINTWNEIWSYITISLETSDGKQGAFKSNSSVAAAYRNENILKYSVLATEKICHYYSCDITGSKEGLAFHSYQY